MRGLGGVASCGHADDSDDCNSRDNKESSYSSKPQRQKSVVLAHTRCTSIRSRMVHVSVEHRSYEEPDGVS